jgi:hypothetical protein
MSEEKLPFAIVPIEAFYDRRLTLTQLRVLGALLSFRSRSTGLVFPGREAIAARTGLPLTKISTTTTQLVALGWLRKTGCGGRSSPCTYEITTPADLTHALLASTETDAELSVETVAESGTVTEQGTLCGERVADAVTVNPLTVAEAGTETVPESGTKGLPNRGRAKKRPLTDQETDGRSVRRASADAGTRLALADLPSDWSAWSMRERPDLDPSKTWHKFHDYWTAQAGSKGRKSDWFAAWRFWVRNEYVDNGHRRIADVTHAHASTQERRQRVHDQIRVNAERHFEEMD